MAFGSLLRNLPPATTPVALIFALLASWAVLIHHDWDIYPQYSYGWLVPPIAAYLFHRRWLDRPTAHPSPLPLAVTLFLLTVSFVAWPLVWTFREANPDWRLLSWSAGLLATTGMLAVLGTWGGRAWFTHFAFPILLLLLAIPWPSGIEQSLIQAMTRAVTATTVEGLTWYGIYAEQTGNVILLARGSVGVDEACSGVRSFQSNLMAALVVGELFRLTAIRRFLLLAIGLAVGFALNLARGMFLAWNADQRGTAGVDNWHDPAGYTILLVSFGLLLLLALRWKKTAPVPAPSAPLPLCPGAPRILAAATLWLVLCPVLNEAWFRAHENWDSPSIHWRLQWPAGSEPRSHPIPDTVRAILRFEEARAFLWKKDSGREWMLYEMDWPPGRAGAQLARSHSPEICLPAAGATLESSAPPRTILLHGLRLQFQPFTFTLRGRPVHVFFVHWEQQDTPASKAPDESYYAHSQRLRAVLEGRRNRGQKVLHATLGGYPDRDAAQKDFLAFLETHIAIDPAGLPSRP